MIKFEVEKASKKPNNEDEFDYLPEFTGGVQNMTPKILRESKNKLPNKSSQNSNNNQKYDF